MKLPPENTEIKIGSYTYTLVFSKEIAAEGHVFGSTHHHTLKIYIDPSTNPIVQEETLLHEILHAILFVSGMGYRFDEKEPQKRPDEEELIRSLSPMFHQVLKDNPHIFGVTI